MLDSLFCKTVHDIQWGYKQFLQTKHSAFKFGFTATNIFNTNIQDSRERRKGVKFNKTKRYNVFMHVPK